MVSQARNTAVPDPSDAQRYAEAIRVAWDRTDPDRDRLRAFQHLARRLSGCLDRTAVAEAVFQLGLALVHADDATISALVSPDEVEILYAHGDPQPAYQPHARLRLRDWRPGADAVTTRAPVWLESPREIQARYPELEPFRERWGHSAWVLVPLVMDERAVGLLGLVYHRRHRFDASERSYIVALADQCAQALHRATLFAAEAESRRRAEAAEQVARRTAAGVTRGDEVTDALAEANTEAEVTRVVFARAADVLGAVAGVVTRRTIDDELEVVEVLGRPEDAPGPSNRVDSEGPHGEVFRTRRPLCRELRDGAGWMAVPLSLRGELSGTLSLTIASMPAGDAARAALLRVLEQCGRALSRARLAESERASRRAAEAAEAETRRLGKLQEQFVAVVAHDLRTPLNAIQLTVKTLFTESDPSEAQSRKVARVSASVERIAEILRTLCDFSQARLAGGIPLHPERVDLGRLARRAVAEVEGAHPGRTIEVSLDEDLGIVGDGARLLQVFSNLLGNAIQHGASEGPVAIRARGEGAAIVIDIHNDGPPIPPALLPSLFEPYRQGEASHASARHTGSMGLGLFIVHEVVHAHGGTVSVDSRPERGTTFTVVVPRLPSHPAPARTSSSPRPELRR
jgi:signal transduction histidine kinase